jgi:hypothetical protein
MKGGAINRILDFEMQEGYIFESGNAVVEVLKDNYGFAGPRYVDLIKDIPEETLNNLRREFEAKIKEEAERQGSVKEEKQILPLSVLLLADKIATDYIFEDGIYLDLPTMVANLKDVNDVSEGQRAYDTLIDYTNVYQARFSSDNDFKPESWGFVKDDCLNIIPSIMRKIAKEENFSVRAFCSWAKSKNLITSNNDKFQNIVRTKSGTKRFYTIKIISEEEQAENEANTGTDGFVDAVQEEIPFT